MLRSKDKAPISVDAWTENVIFNSLLSQSRIMQALDGISGSRGKTKREAFKETYDKVIRNALGPMLSDIGMPVSRLPQVIPDFF